MIDEGGCLGTRKGALWRAEIAQHVEEYLQGLGPASALVDWAVEHPFFDSQEGIGDADRQLIAFALGLALQLDPAEPLATRSTDDQLRALLTLLWAKSEP
jgi:hypothetical protein